MIAWLPLLLGDPPQIDPLCVGPTKRLEYCISHLCEPSETPPHSVSDEAEEQNADQIGLSYQHTSAFVPASTIFKLNQPKNPITSAHQGTENIREYFATVIQ
ncbi:hypothetical protein ACFC0D_38565 [Streptomyces sp. NPDC056222]|uniref:hypothetical protein n=1 Tax=Streptomyces sp. NPDC056222 TaxID=3345749 RepID=UPI0035DAE3FB